MRHVDTKPHVAARPPPSLAVQVTVVVPGKKRAPDAGLQLIVSGADPPVAVGESNASVTGRPPTDVVEMLAGQATVSGGGPGGGATGDFLHDGSDRSTAIATSQVPGRRESDMISGNFTVKSTLLYLQNPLFVNSSSHIATAGS